MSTPSISKMHQRVINGTGGNLPLGAESDVIMPKNNMWDELRKFHTQSIGYLVDFGQGVYEQVKLHLETPALKAKVGNEATLASAITLLSKDITEHRERLNAIMLRQSGYGNDIATQEEIAMMLQIYGEYSDAIELFSGVVKPTMASIAQEMGVLNTVINVIHDVATNTPAPRAPVVFTEKEKTTAPDSTPVVIDETKEERGLTPSIIHFDESAVQASTAAPADVITGTTANIVESPSDNVAANI